MVTPADGNCASVREANHVDHRIEDFMAIALNERRIALKSRPQQTIARDCMAASDTDYRERKHEETCSLPF